MLYLDSLIYTKLKLCLETLSVQSGFSIVSRFNDKMIGLYAVIFIYHDESGSKTRVRKRTALANLVREVPPEDSDQQSPREAR